MTSDPGAARGELTFIGTATVLVRLGSFTFLTDPNFLHAGDHAHLGYGLRSKRLTEPAMSLNDVGPVDFVLLSHHHGDHFDHVVERELDPNVLIITESHSAKKLAGLGFTSVHPLATWEATTLRHGDEWLRITSMPGRHAPRLLQLVLPNVMGSMIEYGYGTESPAHRTYITGDTLLIGELTQIPQRFPDIDLCLIHLGGTRIAGVLLTMDASQGVRLLDLVQPVTAAPIHFDDYTVFKSPLSDFKALVEKADLRTRIHYLDRGDTYRFL